MRQSLVSSFILSYTANNFDGFWYVLKMFFYNI